MKKIVNKQYHRFGNAFKGICTAYKSDSNFKLQMWSGLFFVVFGYFMWPLKDTELLLLILSYVLIIITELQNTSLESALDKIHPERHDSIGNSKDMAASAVLMSGLFALVVVIVISINHL